MVSLRKKKEEDEEKKEKKFGVYDEIRLTNMKQKPKPTDQSNCVNEGGRRKSWSNRVEHKSSLHIRAPEPVAKVKWTETFRREITERRHQS